MSIGKFSEPKVKCKKKLDVSDGSIRLYDGKEVNPYIISTEDVIGGSHSEKRLFYRRVSDIQTGGYKE